MLRASAWPAILTLALLSCATPPIVSQEQRFSGWMLYRGEVMLFSTREAYLDAVTPTPADQSCRSMEECRARLQCISGVLAGDDRDLRAWDGQYVVVTGTLVNYWSLQQEDTPVLLRKRIGDKVVSNFCLRDEVLLVSDIRQA